MSNKRQLKDMYSIEEIKKIESENKKMRKELDFIKTHCQGDIITKYQELQKEQKESFHKEFKLILKINNVEQKLKLLEELFPRYTKAWGSEHKFTIDIEKVIGLCYYYLGNYTKAKELFEELFPRYKKAWGSEHKNTLYIKKIIIKCVQNIYK